MHLNRHWNLDLGTKISDNLEVPSINSNVIAGTGGVVLYSSYFKLFGRFEAIGSIL